MMIEIQIASILHRHVSPCDKNPGGDKWEVPEGSSVAEVLEVLNLANAHTILILNGRQGNKDSNLKAGDVLKIFSAVSGG